MQAADAGSKTLPERCTVARLGISQLDDINGVVTRAVQTWDIPARVKRLAMSSYHYHPADLDHMVLLGARRQHALAGVMALEPAAADEEEDGATLAIHGLYVEPCVQGTGVGSCLIQAAVNHARNRGCRRIVVRAVRQARGFFASQGFQALPTGTDRTGYPHAFCLRLS
jgi:GNAT superfamily N-acetyltransferase